MPTPRPNRKFRENALNDLLKVKTNQSPVSTIIYNSSPPKTSKCDTMKVQTKMFVRIRLKTTICKLGRKSVLGFHCEKTGDFLEKKNIGGHEIGFHVLSYRDSRIKRTFAY